MGLDLRQEMARLVAAALAPSQLGETDGGLGDGHGREGRELPGHGVELVLRLAPGAPPQERLRVVAPAVGQGGGGLPALEELADATEPLQGAVEVAHLLAGREHVATGLPRRFQVVELARQGRGRGLVQPPQALFDVPLGHESKALEGQGHGHDVRAGAA